MRTTTTQSTTKTTQSTTKTTNWPTLAKRPNDLTKDTSENNLTFQQAEGYFKEGASSAAWEPGGQSHHVNTYNTVPNNNSPHNINKTHFKKIIERAEKQNGVRLSESTIEKANSPAAIPCQNKNKECTHDIFSNNINLYSNRSELGKVTKNTGPYNNLSDKKLAGHIGRHEFGHTTPYSKLEDKFTNGPEYHNVLGIKIPNGDYDKQLSTTSKERLADGFMILIAKREAYKNGIPNDKVNAELHETIDLLRGGTASQRDPDHDTKDFANYMIKNTNGKDLQGLGSYEVAKLVNQKLVESYERNGIQAKPPKWPVIE